MSAGRWTLALAGAFALHAMVSTAALADVTFSGGCISGGGFFSGSSNCVFMKRKGAIGHPGIYKIEEPRGEELDAAMERDRKWLARCSPVVRQDAYGVGRYYYAKPGCEFGKLDEY
jgi:hypothetical protein